LARLVTSCPSSRSRRSPSEDSGQTRCAASWSATRTSSPSPRHGHRPLARLSAAAPATAALIWPRMQPMTRHCGARRGTQARCRSRGSAAALRGRGGLAGPLSGHRPRRPPPQSARLDQARLRRLAWAHPRPRRCRGRCGGLEAASRRHDRPGTTAAGASHPRLQTTQEAPTPRR
jgi:hypothetical protein